MLMNRRFGLLLSAAFTTIVIHPGLSLSHRAMLTPRSTSISHRKPARKRRTTTLHVAHGKRECARRRRQIADGQLTPANGLVL